jgi:outer membrane lipoprotein-sorting protein
LRQSGLLTLLREVSVAYRSLKTLVLEAAIITESGDENSSQHSEQRVRFYYAAPDRIRYERCG